MSLDIKIGYDDILKNEKLLEHLTIGQLKGVHYKLHKAYNLKTVRRDIQILIYNAHNILLKKFEQKGIEHSQQDKLDIAFKCKIVNKKIIIKQIDKRKVFLLRKRIRSK